MGRPSTRCRYAAGRAADSVPVLTAGTCIAKQRRSVNIKFSQTKKQLHLDNPNINLICLKYFL